MQRMSEPQMVDAFMRSSTSPWPGAGTATSCNSTVLLPGRNAPFMFDRSLGLTFGITVTYRETLAYGVPPGPGSDRSRDRGTLWVGSVCREIRKCIRETLHLAAARYRHAWIDTSRPAQTSRLPA